MFDYEKQHDALLRFTGTKEIQTQSDPFILTRFPDFCVACGKPFKDPSKIIELRCSHRFCNECMKRLSQLQIQNEENTILRCPECCTDLNDEDIKKIDPNYINTLHQRFLKSLGAEVTSCPRCKTDFIIDEGKFDNNKLDIKGEKYRPQAIECYCKHRVTCPVETCRTNFCAKCKFIPFHDGITCEEQVMLDNDIFCRFCTVFPPVDGDKSTADNRVCWHEECKECLPEACMHVCDCGHACCGIRGEQNHFGCALCNYSICSICRGSCTEKPSVMLRCGHPVHKSCLISRYKSINLKDKLVIPRCGFNNTCEAIPYHECVKDEAEKWINYEKKINESIELRMKVEDTQNEEDHVKNINDPDYYQQPLKFAKDFFVYYLCEKCHQPYYAGHKNCGQNGDEAHNPADDGPHECMRCNRQLMNAICPKHGETGMVFKCMFCCSPSIWLCYNNTTYFCDPCHRRAGSVEHDKSYPACDGHCKFAPHPPNGQRVVSGYCVLCEQEKENQMIYG